MSRLNLVSLLLCGCLLFLPSRLCGQGAFSAPMDLVRDRPYVKVMVNGKGPFTFAIDTGGGGEARVTPHLAEQLGLPADGDQTIGDSSGVNTRKVSVFRINSLQFAGTEFKDVNALQYVGTSTDFDGILCFGLFRDHLLTLDYPNKTITLAHGGLAADGGKEIIPFTTPNQIPVVELTIGQLKLEAYVDSRGGGLSLPEKFTEGLKFASPPIVLGRARTSTNEFEIKGAELASDIRLGRYTFHTPFVTINPVLPVGNFGSGVLKNFAVTFDQKNKLAKFVSKEKSVTLPGPQPKPSS